LTENSQIDKHTRQKLTPFVEITMHAVESKGGFRGGGKGAMPPKMPNIVQHDTETTQCWCALQ